MTFGDRARLGLVLQREGAGSAPTTASYAPRYHALVGGVPSEGPTVGTAHSHNMDEATTAERRITAGMCVARVDGASTLGLAYPDVIGLIKKSTTRTVGFAPAGTLAAAERSARSAAATLVVDGESIGLGFERCAQGGIFSTHVQQIVVGGFAAQHGARAVAAGSTPVANGMLLRSINGATQAGRSYEEVVEELRVADDRPLWLSFLRPRGSSDATTASAGGRPSGVVEVTFSAAGSRVWP